MGRKKLHKFVGLQTFWNVYENRNASEPALTNSQGEIVAMRNQWKLQHFKNTNRLVLELACGRGEYSLGMGRAFTDRNFIGLDIKGARIWQGARVAIAENLQNVAFLRTRIEQIALFFEKDEVDEIWITFPDPFLRESKENRRLTSPNFLKEYRKFLKPKGIVHLKTDDPTLYQFTLDTITADPACVLLYENGDIYKDIAQIPLFTPELELKTYYERMHLAAEKTIKYIRFTIN